ncbi:MAG: hypothetical protein KDE28_03645, partial [Anaerolineales bacterium]|nr:hypothetical protein [Anaerolineales bacterium]
MANPEIDTFMVNERKTSKLMIRYGALIGGIVMLLAVLTAPAGAADCDYVNAVIGYACYADPQPTVFRQPQEFKDSFLART